MIRPDGRSRGQENEFAPRDFRGANGRYKTRTCDLHDVNVAL